MRKRTVLGAGLLTVFATAVLGSSSVASAADPQAPAPDLSNVTFAQTGAKVKQLGKNLTFLGSTNFKASPAKAQTGPGTYSAGVTNRAVPKGSLANAPKTPPSLPTPTAAALPIVGPGVIQANTGLTGFDQRFFGGYSLEPPDPDLCAGNGYVINTANQVMGVYDQAGTALSPPVPFEYFFTDFINNLSDPKCYWDADTKHFFITDLEFPSTFDASGIYIAVSQTGNPLGGWNLYFLDTTNPFGNANCAADGCLADQPLLGADKWTLSISTNEFPWSGGFNGAGYFLLDKTALALGLPAPNVVGINFAAFSTPDGACPTDSTGAPCWYSVQPAESSNANYELHGNGTQYALSALDFFGSTDNRVAIWLFNNTRTISSFSPSIGLFVALCSTCTSYEAPPVAVQAPGSAPLGDVLGPGFNPDIETNDDRMNEVDFNGRTGWLYGGQNTGAYVVNHVNYRAAIAWNGFRLQYFGGFFPVFTGLKGGYIANRKADVLFPSSATFNSGNGLWSYTLTGDTLYPSSAYSTFGNASNPSSIRVANAGVGPEDGFCQYLFGPCLRWGDYSGTATDGGKIFWSDEFIAQTCSLATFLADTTCGGTRGFFINWAQSLDSLAGS